MTLVERVGPFLVVLATPRQELKDNRCGRTRFFEHLTPGH